MARGLCFSLTAYFFLLLAYLHKKQVNYYNVQHVYVHVWLRSRHYLGKPAEISAIT